MPDLSEIMRMVSRNLDMAEKHDLSDVWQTVAMADSYPQAQKLPDPLAGVANFRRVPGYKVYSCGQPSLVGWRTVLREVCGQEASDTKVVWINLRQEPVVYVNGDSLCARPKGKVGEFAELGKVNRDLVRAREQEFKKVVRARAEENEGRLKYVDVTKQELETEVESLKTLSEAVEDLKTSYPGLVHVRVPVANCAAPTEQDFDTICQSLAGTTANTPIVCTDQVGYPPAILLLSSCSSSCFAPALAQRWKKLTK